MSPSMRAARVPPWILMVASFIAMLRAIRRWTGSCGPQHPTRTRPPPAGGRRCPCAVGERGLGEEPVHTIGEAGFERRRIGRVVVHEETGGPVGDDLGDAPDVAGDHGRRARHGLEVDDAERLVDRGAHEDGGVREHLADVAAAEHVGDPVHAVARRRAARPRRRRSRRPAPVCRRRRRAAPPGQSGSKPSAARSRWGTPFWRVIRPTKATIGRFGIDAEPGEHVDVGVGSVEVGVDAVVHDVDPRRVERRVGGEHVGA